MDLATAEIEHPPAVLPQKKKRNTPEEIKRNSTIRRLKAQLAVNLALKGQKYTEIAQQVGMSTVQYPRQSMYNSLQSNDAKAVIAAEIAKIQKYGAIEAIDELHEVKNGAIEHAQYGPATAAVMGKAKIAGLLDNPGEVVESEAIDALEQAAARLLEQDAAFTDVEQSPGGGQK